MKSQTKQPGPTVKQAIIAIVILFSIAAGIILLIWSLQQRDSQQYQQQVSDTQALNNCLQSAWDTLDSKWSDSIDPDMGHTLTIAYYNDQIDCHSRLNVADNKDTEIKSLTTRKENEQTSYKVRSESNSAQQSDRTSCITSAVGSSAYTHCY